MIALLASLALLATPLAGIGDRQVSPGVWRVAFGLSALQGGHPMAVARAHYRAAEIVKQHGFAYMRILNAKGFELDLTPGGPLFGGGPGYAQLTVRGATGPEDVEGCLARDKSRCTTLAVDEVLTRWAQGAPRKR